VGAKVADELREAHFVLAGGLHVRVGHTEVAAPGDFQDFGSEGGFFRACFRSAARAHFTGSKVEDAGLVSLMRHFDEGATAGEFDVVGVGGNGENVEFHGAASDKSWGL